MFLKDEYAMAEFQNRFGKEMAGRIRELNLVPVFSDEFGEMNIFMVLTDKDSKEQADFEVVSPEEERTYDSVSRRGFIDKDGSTAMFLCGCADYITSGDMTPMDYKLQKLLDEFGDDKYDKLVIDLKEAEPQEREGIINAFLEAEYAKANGRDRRTKANEIER